MTELSFMAKYFDTNAQPTPEPLKVGDTVRSDMFPSCHDGTIVDFDSAAARPDLVFAVVYWRDSVMRISHHPVARLKKIEGEP